MERILKVIGWYEEGSYYRGEMIWDLHKMCVSGSAQIEQIPEQYRTEVQEVIDYSKTPGAFWINRT